MSQVHAKTRTTPRTRAEIKDASDSLAQLAERYNINRSTARKCKGRTCPQDRSHRPHKLSTTLSPAQEAIVVELRRSTKLPLDDLVAVVAVVRELIQPGVSRSGLAQLLAPLRRGQSAPASGPGACRCGGSPTSSKDLQRLQAGLCANGHQYLTQMPHESQRRYLFVANDWATRWVFMRIYGDQSEVSSVEFVNCLQREAPMKIIKLLTDNGSQFNDRFTSKKREPTGLHKCDVRCKALNIAHRLCPPRHHQTKGKVERFNGRISEVVKQTRFASAAQLETTLANCVKTCNPLIPQRALNHVSPDQALKNWQAKKPELFVKRVYNKPGLDM